MRVLAIDTALAACSAAVLDTRHAAVVASETLPMVRGHAEAMMPLIARVMDQAGDRIRQLDRIAVTTGPGSFTGLRVGISAARGIALAAGKPAVGLSTLAGFAAPHIAENDNSAVVAAIDARHEHVYLQVFGPGGRTVVPPRIAPLTEAVRAATGGAGAHRRLRRRADRGAWPTGRAAAGAGRAAGRARHRLDRAARRRRRRRARAAEAALSARARRAAAGRRAPATPMIGLLTRLFARGEPVLSEATPRDAAAIAALHAASFHRGWSEDEIERLLIERNVLTHRATVNGRLVGFIMSRIAAGEAEILSVAVASSYRGKGLARRLLDLHLRRLAGIGTRVVFLEVDEGNAAARAALPARRLRRGRPPRGLLRWCRRQPGDGAGAAPRSGVTAVGHQALAALRDGFPPPGRDMRNHGEGS